MSNRQIAQNLKSYVMKTKKKILRTPLRIAISLLIIGFICKILLIPKIASPLIVLSLAAIAILYSLRFLKKSKKGFLEYTKLVMVVFWSLDGIFKILELSFTDSFQLIGGLAFIIWIIMEGTTYLISDKGDSNNLTNRLIWNTIMVLGILEIIIGSLGKILQWEYAVPIIILGTIMVTLYVFKDTLTQKLQNREK